MSSDITVKVPPVIAKILSALSKLFQSSRRVEALGEVVVPSPLRAAHHHLHLDHTICARTYPLYTV